MNLGKNCKIMTGLDYAEGATDRTGAEADMQGWDGILIITKFAAIATGATTVVKAQQDTATGMGSAADLTGTGITVADNDDDQIFVIDLYKPLERFVRGYVDKDTSNNSAESMIYVLYSGSKAPFANNQTDEVTYELHVSPAEGTA